MTSTPEWLHVRQGSAPLLLSMPHAGTDLRGLEDRLVSPGSRARTRTGTCRSCTTSAKDLDATIVRTDLSRTVIDVNRDPTGQSLYPGQATTELCPTTTFDGEPLYRDGLVPSEAEIAERRALYFAPYHAALRAETARLLNLHPRVVVYDCHSIRSSVPRLFEGLLPHFNIGTNSGKSCAPELARSHRADLRSIGVQRRSTTGRFKGGYITRSLGAPEARVHAIQMELAMRGYLHEQPGAVSETDWPPPYEPNYAALQRDVLRAILKHSHKFCDQAGLEEISMSRVDSSRVVRAPRGTTLSAKSWQTEAPLRMLMNNLIPKSRSGRASWSRTAESAAPLATGKATTASSRR